MSLTLHDVHFGYPQRPLLLHGASLDVRSGESVALMAPSGEGKSTALSIAGLLLAPDQGDVLIDGQVRTTRDADRLLGTTIAWLPQQVNLLPRRSVVDNVALALLSRGWNRAAAYVAAAQRLRTVGLEGSEQQQARTVSGGEAQRVGIARALATEPVVLFADEPTANLDGDTAHAVARTLLRAATGTTVVIATHDPRIAAMTDRLVVLEHGTFREVIGT